MQSVRVPIFCLGTLIYEDKQYVRTGIVIYKDYLHNKILVPSKTWSNHLNTENYREDVDHGTKQYE